MPYRWMHVAEVDRHQWVLERNCALTPRQLGGWFGTLAVAFLAYGRHAGDYERIVATPERLMVETSTGARLDRLEREAGRVRIRYGGSRREPIRLVSGREEIAIGRFVPDDRKAELVRELRGALARWRAG